MKHFDINTDAESLLGDVFEGLHSGGGRSSIPGGQTVANQALANLDIRGYAKKRSAVLPIRNRGTSVLSPYIRHNILSLQTIWGAVSAAPEFDKEKLRDELFMAGIRQAFTCTHRDEVISEPEVRAELGHSW